MSQCVGWVRWATVSGALLAGHAVVSAAPAIAEDAAGQAPPLAAAASEAAQAVSRARCGIAPYSALASNDGQAFLTPGKSRCPQTVLMLGYSSHRLAISSRR